MDKKTLNLTDLNEYCLFKILDFLDLSDQIKFLSICNRFKNVYFQYMKIHKTNKIDLNSYYFNSCGFPKLNDLFNAFTTIGPIIYKFKVKFFGKHLHSYYQILELLLKNCVNLEYVEINNKSVNTYQNLRCSTPDFHTYIDLIAINIPNCEFLKLKDLQIFDIDIKVLSQSKLKNKLKYLDISKHKEITGRYLENFKNLKFLNLAKCCGFNTTNLDKIFISLTSLKHLDLEFIYKLNDYQLGLIINNCNKLQTLKFNVTFIGGFENLKRLNQLRRLQNLSVIETSRGTTTDIIKCRNIFNKILTQLAMQLRQVKFFCSKNDYQIGLKICKKLNLITDFKRITFLHLEGYINCDKNFWNWITILQHKTLIKNININVANSLNDFAFKECCQCLKMLIKTKLKINLRIREKAIFSNNFLQKLVQALSDETYEFKNDYLFVLWVDIEKENKSLIENMNIYQQAMEIFNIKLEESYNEYYSSNKYHENELYLTELNPLQAKRKLNLVQRTQELLEIQQYNLDNKSSNVKISEILQKYYLNDFKYTLESNQKYEVPKGNNSLSIDFEEKSLIEEAQITFNSNININLINLKKYPF